jgi:hypothetical protein
VPKKRNRRIAEKNRKRRKRHRCRDA